MFLEEGSGSERAWSRFSKSFARLQTRRDSSPQSTVPVTTVVPSRTDEVARSGVSAVFIL